MGISLVRIRFAAALAIIAAGCAPENSFRLNPAEEKFDLVKSLDPKVDILWVVDNSTSMEPSQKKLRNGFGTFARKYMKPDWDIRTAVITTDAYLANPAFRATLEHAEVSTVNYDSKYLKKKTGKKGVPLREINPTIGPDYARLLPGIHDGPIKGLCFERNYYFFYGLSNCQVRDASTSNQGVAGCLKPAEGETSEAQCVNTVNNDSVHSGRAILSTREGSTDELIEDFMINASTGAAGAGSERGFSSIQQLIADNEKTSTAFFRKGSFRIIVFLTDEDDQSMVLPEPGEDDMYAQYKRSRCPERKVPFAKKNGKHEFKLGLCPKEDKLLPVEAVKKGFDAFFSALDGGTAPNYIVVSIVPIAGETLKDLQEEQQRFYKNIAMPISHDEGRRYIKLGAMVGNGSLAMDIGEQDYSGILDRIGLALVEHFRVFELKRAPTSQEQMIVTILRSGGGAEVIPAAKWKIEGLKLTLTDEALVLGMKAGDRISIAYQPRTLK